MSLTLRSLKFQFVFILLLLSILKPVKVSSQTVCVPGPSNMEAWLPGDGNANEIQGASDGILGNEASYVPGMVDQSFTLDGINDYVSVPDNVPSNNLDGFSQLTLDAWVFPGNQLWINPNTGGFTNAIISKYDTTNPSGASYYLDLENGKLRIVVFQSAQPEIFAGWESDVVLPVGAWSHVAGVWRGGSLFELYINGSLVTGHLLNSGSPITIMADNNTPVNIGRFASFGGTFVGPGGYFNGLIDEVEIFSRGLSGSEIGAIYAAGNVGKCKNPSSVSGILMHTVTSRTEGRGYFVGFLIAVFGIMTIYVVNVKR